MTTETVCVKLAGGETVLMEVEELDVSGVQAVSLSVNREAGTIDLESALVGVRAAATQLAQTIRDLTTPPDSFELSFGVKLNASLGAIIAKASTEANFTVKLSWSGPKG